MQCPLCPQGRVVSQEITTHAFAQNMSCVAQNMSSMRPPVIRKHLGHADDKQRHNYACKKTHKNRQSYWS